MCTTCGCSGSQAEAPLHSREHTHERGKADDPRQLHESSRGEEAPRVLRLEQDILARNDLQAGRNRALLSAQGVLALNLMSSPGSGKTTLLERTIRDLGSELPIQVIEGDQATDHDARRLQEIGCPVVQLNTGTGCHLDATMVDHAMQRLPLGAGSVLVIENVGNLVCPALFDLGEHARVVVSAVTDGEDKPVKYPHMFRAATVVVLNKVDLLPYVSFDPGRFLDFARQVNPHLRMFPLSATRGDGVEEWYRWLRGQARTAGA